MRETEFCKHYRAMIDHDTCSKGVAYANFNGTKCADRPCFRKCGCAPNPGCALMDMPTEDEIKEREKEIAERIVKLLMARDAIEAAIGCRWKRGADEVRGRIDCPVCKQKGCLTFIRSGYNGHIKADCQTEGCVRWYGRMCQMVGVTEKKHVIWNKDTKKFYRGAKLWKWTRFRSQAAFLSWNSCERLCQEGKIDGSRVLVFGAPKDRWPLRDKMGRAIVGVRVVFRVDVTFWNWKPYFKWSPMCRFLGWLCFSINMELQYEE